jgi:hypothetical protein
MTDLSPEAKILLQSAREAFSPTDERTAAVRRALDARLAALGDAAAKTGASAGQNVVRWTLSRIVGISLVAAAFATLAIMIALGPPRAGSAHRNQAIQAAHVTEPSSPAPELLQPTAAPAPKLSEDPTATTQKTAASRAVVPEPATQKAAARAVVPEPRAVGARKKTPAPATVHKRDSSSTSIARAALATSAAPSRESSRDGSSSAQPALETAAPTEAASAVSAPAPEPKNSASKRTAAPDDSLGRETALLLRARAALAKHDAPAALALADEHASQFPNGRLVQERLAVRALAFCALGRLAQARAATRELERIAPRSPHLMRKPMTCPTPPSLP